VADFGCASFEAALRAIALIWPRHARFRCYRWRYCNSNQLGKCYQSILYETRARKVSESVESQHKSCANPCIVVERTNERTNHRSMRWSLANDLGVKVTHVTSGSSLLTEALPPYLSKVITDSHINGMCVGRCELRTVIWHSML
jgi:hypothetical protein